MRFLSRAQCINLRFPQSILFSDNKNVLNSCKPSFVRKLYTDCKLYQNLSYAFKMQNSKETLESLSDMNYFKEIDNQYMKSITLPTNCHHLEEFLWNQEFKDILSRSSFLYNVNLINNSDNYFSPLPLSHFEDSLDYISNTQKLNQPDEVKMDSNKSQIQNSSDGKPTEEQLLNVINRLTYSLLKFFEKPHDFSLYSKDIVFQNNIKGVTTRGLMAYMQNMYLIKIFGHFHYAKIKVEILKITHHIEDGTIRVRWQILGISRYKVVLSLIKFKSINWKYLMENQSESIDGFSVFSVGSDGLVFKHVCDKMMPDDELSKAKESDLKTRLLGLLGLHQRTPIAGGLHYGEMFLYPRGSIEIFPHKKIK